MAQDGPLHGQHADSGFDPQGRTAEIAAIHKPPEQLRAVLEAAGAPTTPEALGWPREFYLEAVRHARLIRNRYTFLDLAADGGFL